MNRLFVLASAATLLATGVPATLAVKPAFWTHEQPKDFLDGELENVVVSSLGEVSLGRDAQTLHVPGAQTEVINALVRAGDGRLYAATGPRGIIYRIDGEQVTEFARLPNGGSVLSLVFARDGRLLAGTGGGDQAAIYVIDGEGDVEPFHEPEDARYIWAMGRGPDGEIYAATGVEGKLFVIDADGQESRVLAELKPKNLLCLAFGPDGMIYTGTDEEGLIYRVNPDSGATYVMYDAKEAEISALVVDRAGNLYASTAAADQARPGRTVADRPGGQPEGDAETQPAADDDAAAAQADEGPARPQAAPTPRPRPVGRPVQGRAAAEGNAIYRIDRDGFVNEVFREPVMILAMTEADGTIYAATGDEGRIYAITPSEDRTTMLAKLEPSQATAILRLPDNTLLLGSANEAELVRLADRFAEKGTLISPPFDAQQIVRWGRVHWTASVPAGTRLTVATRTGNVEDRESDAWDEWSPEVDATAPQQIASPGARFLQYRLTFETTVPNATPSLRKLEMSRIEENRPPRIGSLEVVAASEEARRPGSHPSVKQLVMGPGRTPEDPGPDAHWVVKWTAEDPNNDTLSFEVYFREIERQRWVRLVKDHTDPLYIWDTRTVADGRYEVRLVASDVKSNPPGTELTDTRISDPVIVDNTPPEIVIERMEPQGRSAVAVRAVLRDALSPIKDAAYSVNSSEDWIPLAADDDIFDTMTESVTFTIRDLDPGEHWIALRARDRQGNVRYASRAVVLGE